MRPSFGTNLPLSGQYICQKAFFKHALTGGQTDLKKKKPVQYTVEREYLAKFSAEELLIRIIRAHLNQDAAKRNITK